MSGLRLNLGSGAHPLEGWENLDAATGGVIYPLPYPDASIEEIRASHVLEHFPHGQVADVLREWVRVLKFGGTIKIAVPDFDKIARGYLAGERAPFQQYVMGGQVDERDHHGTIFGRETLTELMHSMELGRIEKWTSEIADCAALPVSLNLQGTKVDRSKPIKIQAAMSVPRLGFMDNMFSIMGSLPPLGITVQRFMGAFWGQCLERTMEDLLDSDYLLTIDYDTVFDLKNVVDLIRLVRDYPEADAIAPVQVGRGDMGILASFLVDGETKTWVPREAFEANLVPAATAHFGLTMIKTAALKDLPHPWFLGQPNADGQWREGHVDDDTYFWRKWVRAGKKAYIAPRVVVGHAQCLVTWPDENLEPIHQMPNEFFESGPPRRVWE